MSSIILEQNTADIAYVYLENLDGTPATGLTVSGLSFYIKKSNASVFSNLIPVSFTDLAGGTYSIGLAASDTDTLGNLVIKVTGTTVHTELVVCYVTDQPVVPPATVVLPVGRVSVFGYLVDPSGDPVKGAAVFARVLKAPNPPLPATDFITVGPLTTSTDDTGFFSLILLSDLEMDITIPAVNYRRTITVPAINTNLFDIP